MVSKNLLIIGVFKGGTTSLFKYLADHPKICGAKIKETHFFSSIVYANGDLESFSSYSDYFNNCHKEKFFLEATPSYFYGNLKMIHVFEQIFRTDHKLLLILRNPTDRFISYYHYIKSRFLIDENMSFEDFVHECKLQDDLSTIMQVGHFKNTFKEGIYSQFLKVWFTKYSKENLKVIFFDDLINDPKKMILEVIEWLKIDDKFYDSYDFNIQNKTVLPVNAFLHKIAIRLNDLFIPFWRKNDNIKNSLRDLYYYFNASKKGKETISKSTRKELEDFYEPYNRQLRELLLDYNPQIDLPDWLESLK